MNCVTNIGQQVVNSELREAQSGAKPAVIVFRECVQSLFHFTSSASLRYAQKIPKLAYQYLYDSPPFCLFTCVKMQSSARNRRFKFKLEFKADRVQLKMVQRTIAVNQFTATYLIEFSAEPRWCNRPKACHVLCASTIAYWSQLCTVLHEIQGRR